MTLPAKRTSIERREQGRDQGPRAAWLRRASISSGIATFCLLALSLCHISGNTVHHLPSWTRWWFEDARLISEPSEHTLLGRSFVDRLESFRTKWDIPGFVLAMTASPAFTHGGEEWKQEVYSFGQAKGAGDNVTEDTMWAIASNSKLFNALSVGLLIDRKTRIPGGDGEELSYETKVKDVLPWWQLMDRYTEEHITILDLLSMRSGMPSHDMYLEQLPPHIQLKALGSLKPSTELRETWQYNNQHYFTLSEIVRTISGQSLTDYVQLNIFDPLNMTSTTYNSRAALATGKRSGAFLRHGIDWEACRTWKEGAVEVPKGCLGHREDFGWWTATDGLTEAAAGGVVMSGRDMTKWLRELLDPQVFPSSLISKLGEPVIVIPGTSNLPDTSTHTYSLAQVVYTYRGHKVIEHTGNLPGARSLSIRLPNLGLGMMIAVNDDDMAVPFYRAIAYMVVDHLLDLPERDWEGRLMPSFWSKGEWTDPPETPTPPEPSTLRMYTNPAYGTLNFTNEVDQATFTALRGMQEPLNVACNTTYVAHINKVFANTLAFTHFDGHLWNWTALLMYDTPNGRYLSPTYASGSAIVTDAGIGMFGNYWVAGPSVAIRHASKSSVKDDAEVWYDRVVEEAEGTL